MNDQTVHLSELEQKALINVCFLAAFADGTLSDAEAAEIRRVAEKFFGPGAPITLPLQPATLASVAQDISSADAKNLAYELAVCVCQADQSASAAEQKFLGQLRDALKLDPGASAAFQTTASRIQEAPPVIGNLLPVAPAGLDQMIKDRAILTGALEIMPHRLATMAIIPIQMRLVYSIGKSFGFDLDLAHTKEFLATVGVGLTSQVVEGYLSKVVRHVARPFLGGFIASLASQATESAFAFATTYALGQVAKTYYGSGRTLSTGQLRDLFSNMLSEGRAMQTRYSNQISQKAGTLNIADFVGARAA